MIILAMAFTAAGCGKNTETTTETRLAVATVAAQKGSIQRVVTYSGTIKGANEVTIYPKVSARVVAIRHHEGDQVRKGETIIVLDTTDYSSGVTSAEAGLAQAESNYDIAAKNLDRTQALFQQGAASPQQLEQAQSGVTQANAAVELARSTLQTARNTLANCQITSPIDGVVGLLKITEGNMATPQAPVAMVSSQGEFRVKFSVSESDIPYVSLNNPAQVKVDSLSAEVLKGHVAMVSPVADAATKGYPVEIAVDGSKGKLKSGMFAEVSLSTEKKDNAIIIPRAAIIEKGAREVVYSVDNKSVAHEQEVTLGIVSQGQAEVASGVKPGENIVVKGQTLLHDGDKVKVVSGGKV
jgi:RND family efflux transporter MFP subunit